MSNPITIGDHLDGGFRPVEITCTECHHHASVDVSGMPRDIAIPDIAKKAKCTKCDSRRCTSRPDIKEYYAKLAETTGKSHKG